MPIHPLCRAGNIKPEDAERLNRAFLLALSHLDLVERNDPICEIVARKVIEIRNSGISEPEVIAEMAYKQLRPF